MLAARLEEAVVDQHVARDCLDPGRCDLAARWSSPASGSPATSVAFRVAAGVGVVVVLEEQRAVRPGPAAEAEVAPGDEDQVALERPVVVDLAPADDRRLEAVVGAEVGQRRPVENSLVTEAGQNSWSAFRS